MKIENRKKKTYRLELVDNSCNDEVKFDAGVFTTSLAVRHPEEDEGGRKCKMRIIKKGFALA